MSYRLIILILFFSAYIVVYGCSSGNKMEPTLSSGKWQLQMLNGKPVSLPEGKKVTLEINTQEGKAFGEAPCNRYYCSYDQYNSQLKFNTVISTEMACDDMGKESEYYTMLGNVTGFSRTSQKLILYNGDKVIAEYVAEK